MLINKIFNIFYKNKNWNIKEGEFHRFCLSFFLLGHTQ
ncbi:hypothetical protein B4119_3170 [Parageobacillus caldoxylosilyticus]|uniref:Uncharacterized protein n=1 Tax=Saccharococcus caldoxylosilyticus TaxID=81408 RepID=A0A150M543_9BACL|nr:hypothetical protein B4119_3170 [Parageobacillus caldoxylosilyticus]